MAADEGWNPGLHDAAAFHAADAGGFLVGLLDGEPIGCISAVRYPDAFGFIGFYIVVPAQRGKGYGLRLWNAGIERLAGCNIGLDGVFEQKENYERSGFRFEYSNIRFEGVRSEGGFDDNARVDVAIVPIAGVPLDAIGDYDRTVFPSSRLPFLRAWVAQGDSAAYAAIDNGQVAGYGVIRKCRSGSKIGPLFADTAAIGERLHAALSRHATEEEPVYLDVPEVNAAAMSLAQRLGMREVFRAARMYTGASPPIAIDRIFGVTTFELG